MTVFNFLGTKSLKVSKNRFLKKLEVSFELKAWVTWEMVGSQHGPWANAE